MSTIVSVNPPKGTTVAAIQVTIYMLNANKQPILQLFSQVYGPPGGTLFTANFNAPTLLANSSIPCSIFVQAFGANGMPIAGGQDTNFFYIQGYSPPGM